MAAAAAELADDHAEVPKEWGKNLVACLTCKLVKTQEQVLHMFDLSCMDWLESNQLDKLL